MKGTDSVVSILSWFGAGGVVDSDVTSFLIFSSWRVFWRLWPSSNNHPSLPDSSRKAALLSFQTSKMAKIYALKSK